MDYRDTADLTCDIDWFGDQIRSSLGSLFHNVRTKQEKQAERVKALLDLGWREYKIIGIKAGIATEAESVFVPPGTTFAPEFADMCFDNTDDLRDMVNGEGHYAEEEEYDEEEADDE